MFAFLSAGVGLSFVIEKDSKTSYDAHITPACTVQEELHVVLTRVVALVLLHLAHICSFFFVSLFSMRLRSLRWTMFLACAGSVELLFALRGEGVGLPETAALASCSLFHCLLLCCV